MASRVGKLVLLASLGLLASGAIGLAVPLAASAHANACQRFGDIKAHNLGQGQAARSVRCLLNRARHRHGLTHLSNNGRLERAAKQHTSYMQRHDCFSHQCPGEPSLLSRLEGVNYVVGGLTRWVCGENIAWGSGPRGTPRAIVEAWMRSPEHRANILDPQFRHVGVGFTRWIPRGRGSNGGTYTTDFGMRKH
jgi:uncharacterized protein YkwD